ncbi:hypothetical protein ACFWZ2_28715 [Streptomyces sp. NPDC059002]|uniref:hypothetical protein n=1 Tax=Streptomyces sp. NPDC059002 TaxID=3346690 RepID=UPI0036ADD527
MNPVNVFADQGAWHAYALPKEGDRAAYGGFSGPLYLAQEYPWWPSTSFSRIRLTEDGHALDLAAGGASRLTLSLSYRFGAGLRRSFVGSVDPRTPGMAVSLSPLDG